MIGPAPRVIEAALAPPERPRGELVQELRQALGNDSGIGRGARRKRRAEWWLHNPRCYFCGQTTVWHTNGLPRRHPLDDYIRQAFLDPLGADILVCHSCCVEREARRDRKEACLWPECQHGRPEDWFPYGRHEHTPFRLTTQGRHNRLRDLTLRMWKFDPRCHWCRVPTARVRRGVVSADSSTFDHLYQKWDPRRYMNDYVGVLAHRSCNTYRGNVLRRFVVNGNGLLVPLPFPGAMPASLAREYERRRLELARQNVWWRRLQRSIRGWLRSLRRA